LKQLYNHHRSELNDLLTSFKEELIRTEKDLNDLYLNRYIKSAEALDLEKKIEIARSKDSWEEAEHAYKQLLKVEEIDKRTNMENNKKIINDKINLLKAAQNKK
jgi:hypothetical protein